MNVLENDEESLVGTGSHRRLFDDQLGWPTTSDPAPISQRPPSTPQDDCTYTELLRYYAHTRLQLLPNDLSDVPQLYYANVGPKNATAEFLDVADSSFNPPSGHQDPTEGVSLPASCPLPFGPTFDGRDPSPTEGPAFPSASRYFEGTLFPSASDLQPPPSLHRSIELDHLHFSQTLPQTPIDETDVTRDASHMLVPRTRPLSWARSHSGESGGNETFSATMAIRGSTRDSSTATTPLGTTTTFLPSSSQEVLELLTHLLSRSSQAPGLDFEQLYSPRSLLYPQQGSTTIWASSTSIRKHTSVYPTIKSCLGAPKLQEVLVQHPKMFLWLRTEARLEQTCKGHSFMADSLPLL